ncbi:MAG: YraN family protein [Lachnospiraceae bacterium]|nr:YraN family protein [Lachnospiraceae bacterium]
MNKRKVGKAYEEKAEAYLKKQGVEILERNFQVRQGEIDLIGYHKGILVFVEVKYRKDKRKGLPEEAVTIGKQRRISKAAEFYLMLHPKAGNLSCRYDVVAICGEEITWYENAFMHQWKK